MVLNAVISVPMQLHHLGQQPIRRQQTDLQESQNKEGSITKQEAMALKESNERNMEKFEWMEEKG